MLWTFIFDVITIENKNEQSKLIVIPNNQIECQEICSIDYCFKYSLLNKNCTKFIRDQCNCCTVCLRYENEICGGRFNVYGICEQDLFCYKSNKTTKNLSEQMGICVKACLKFQCLSIIKNNKTICECLDRRIPCDENLYSIINDNCKHQIDLQQEHKSSFLKTLNIEEFIDCSNIICNNTSICPSDSQFIENQTPLLRTSLSQTKNLSSICCESRGHCAIQIFLDNVVLNLIALRVDSQQCHHDKKIYNENETWSIDHCTTCTCRAGHVDCAMIQCPIYTHCGYMYKPENECCPKCGGCLNDRFHIQHMNSTWIESNGCMRCWCENGQSRCIAEGCIAPPCENPRQIANVCCPVCDDDDDDDDEEYLQNIDTITQSISQTLIYKCPILNNCLIVCEHGLTKDEHGCFQCACSTMSCPTPLCTLKFDKLSKQYCLCLPPINTNCQPFHCDKHCPYNYSIDYKTGCPYCACNSCPQLICTKNCTYGLKKNDIGCSICVCESNFTLNTELILHSWSKQCLSGLFTYSNGEIWFDGCRQCLCHKGEQLCALISCPTPKCSQPIILPNRCCPSCPDIPMLPEPTPSSQVCYASQYVTGEELEFDKCTKCICLHNIAFCSISLCPPFPCSSPIHDSSLCCPTCPITSESSSSSIIDISNTNEDVCILDNGMIKNAGELWKTNDCQSCLCPRDSTGQIKCFPQICNQQLPCSNPVLKKGECCPFCLPPTAAVAVCIFNFIQYRSGEHWNVSECHHCECSLGTIVCHQQKCPTLTCIHTVTLSGHCCPICRDQLYLINDQGKLRISSSRFGFSIIIIFFILILILLLIIIILIFILLNTGRRSISSSNHISNINQHSPKPSHHSTIIKSKSSNIFSYPYDLMLIPNDMKNTKQILPSSNNNNNNNPLTSIEQTSTHSIIGTNTTGTNSINNELEPITWNENDTLILHCGTSSNDDDYEHEIINSDNEEFHQQKLSHQQFQIITGPPTIIYV
ncbi:unnamed protein product [Rotaria sordida]|uniref:Cysteine-rich motor neuron 1 protein n=1 Tax=Rotaria sordida TaxID=392033 RepID=A0A815WTV4_9BILA|nr:unnamed protein product [Rotaria sordida]CAF1547449.1 unnamed protein product [Rotaria sordida]